MTDLETTYDVLRMLVHCSYTRSNLNASTPTINAGGAPQHFFRWQRNRRPSEHPLAAAVQVANLRLPDLPVPHPRRHALPVAAACAAALWEATRCSAAN